MAGFEPGLIGKARLTEPLSGTQEGLPRRVLFACNMNAVRSPMAAAMLRKLTGGQVDVQSAGVHAGQLNGFAVAVMAEKGVDISAHEPQTFGDLEEDDFDLIITMTPEAHHNALELTRNNPKAIVEFWPTTDPTVAEGRGSREQVLEVYRALRDELWARIKQRLQDYVESAGQ